MTVPKPVTGFASASLIMEVLKLATVPRLITCMMTNEAAGLLRKQVLLVSSQLDAGNELKKLWRKVANNKLINPVRTIKHHSRISN